MNLLKVESCGQAFWHLDPVKPRNILPDPDQNPKRTFYGPTRTDPIIFYPIRTEAFYMLISVLPLLYLLRLGMFDMVFI